MKWEERTPNMPIDEKLGIAINMARENNDEVEFTFNCVRITVNKESDISDLIAEYNIALLFNLTRIGPYANPDRYTEKEIQKKRIENDLLDANFELKSIVDQIERLEKELSKL